MKEVLYTLLSAALVYYSALAAGRLLFRLLKIELYAVEERYLAFTVGAGVLSVPIFLLSATHLAYKATFLVVGLGMVVAGWKHLGRARLAELPPTPPPWRAVFWLFYAVYGVVYLVNALAPEASQDGSTHHLGFVAQYYRQHGFGAITTSMFANYPQGLDMLFFMAYPFAKHSGMVHALFLFALPFGMWAYGRRFGIPAAGVTGALLFFIIPVVGKDGTSAYVDVGLAAILFACFYLLEIWDSERKPALLVPIGLLAGYAYAIKYSGGPAIIFVVVYILWRLRRTPAAAFRNAALAVLPAILMILPWVLKNIIIVGNPFSPLANEWFPNPYIHVSFEREFRQMMSNFGGVPSWRLPFEACVRGRGVNGFVGPVFLASWISGAALTNVHGRRLLVSAALWSLPFVHAPEIRYLIPALPFLSIAFGIALSWRAWMAISVLFAHAALSWPCMMPRYCDRYAWRLREIPWAAAFRIAPEGPYVASFLGDAYEVAARTRKLLTPGETIFALDGFPRSYSDQNIVVGWESAFGERMRDALYCAMFHDTQPSRRLRYAFQQRTTTKLRLVQEGRSETQQWSISELRLYNGEKELAPAPGWRLSAHPNAEDVALAFDRNPVTRWSTWRSFEPGMFYEVDFGEAVAIDRIVAQGTRDQDEARIRLESWSGSGWTEMAGEPTVEDTPADPGWRRDAIKELKRNGLKWMLVKRSDWGADDLHANVALWGIRAKLETRYHTLFRLD